MCPVMSVATQTLYTNLCWMLCFENSGTIYTRIFIQLLLLTIEYYDNHDAAKVYILQSISTQTVCTDLLVEAHKVPGLVMGRFHGLGPDMNNCDNPRRARSSGCNVEWAGVDLAVTVQDNEGFDLSANHPLNI